MMMTAPVMTSCSSDLEEVAPEVVTPETGTHVETLTITFPVQAETRVGVDDNNKLTGWDEGDEVTLVQTGYEKPEEWDQYSFILKGTYTFSCTDAAKGTFRGTLPNDVSVKDCQLAFYNATDFAAAQSYKRLCFSPKNRASQDMKDVVMLVAKNDGEGHFTMQIFGSILAVTNENNYNITASVKYQLTNDDMSRFAYYYDCAANAYIQPDGYFGFMTNYASSKKHTFTLGKNALTYVYRPVFNIEGSYENFAVGVSAEGDAEDECSLVPFKANPGNAKLFKMTLEPPAKSGTAKATIGGNEVDVKWVQLWENGPKFAEHNVASKMIFEDAAKTGTEYVWGANWRTPSKDDMNELLLAATNAGSEKVTCVYDKVEDVPGFIFTGKEPGYTNNSLFLPAQAAHIGWGGAYYWSRTSSSDYPGYAWAMYLYYNYDEWRGEWIEPELSNNYFVRPVLVEATE